MNVCFLSESKKTPARISSRNSVMRTPNYLSTKQTPNIDNIASFKKFRKFIEKKNAVIKVKWNRRSKDQLIIIIL